MASQEDALRDKCADFLADLRRRGFDPFHPNDMYSVYLECRLNEYEELCVELVKRGPVVAEDDDSDEAAQALAAYDSEVAGEFHALRRLMGILLQEREMLYFSPAQRATVRFDEAFVASGRSCV